MKASTRPSIRGSVAKVQAKLIKLRRYSLILFLLLVAGLYGFLLFRITSLSGAEPTTDAIDSQVKAVQVPHIDEAVVRQLQSLEDNSNSVKSLFDDARSNPFQ